MDVEVEGGHQRRALGEISTMLQPQSLLAAGNGSRPSSSSSLLPMPPAAPSSGWNARCDHLSSYLCSSQQQRKLKSVVWGYFRLFDFHNFVPSSPSLSGFAKKDTTQSNMLDACTGRRATVMASFAPPADCLFPGASLSLRM